MLHPVAKFALAAGLGFAGIPQAQADLPRLVTMEDLDRYYPPITSVPGDRDALPLEIRRALEEAVRHMDPFMELVLTNELLSDFAGAPVVKFDLSHMAGGDNDTGLELRALIKEQNPQWVKEFDEAFRQSSLEQGATESEILLNEGIPYLNIIDSYRMEDIKGRWLDLSVLSPGYTESICLVNKAPIFENEASIINQLHVMLAAHECSAAYPNVMLDGEATFQPAAFRDFMAQAELYGFTQAQMDTYVAYSFNYGPQTGLRNFVSYYLALSGQDKPTDDAIGNIVSEISNLTNQLGYLSAEEEDRVLTDIATNEPGLMAAFALTRMLWLHQTQERQFDYDLNTPLMQLVGHDAVVEEGHTVSRETKNIPPLVARP